MNSADRALAKLLVERSFIPGDFTLSSGRLTKTELEALRAQEPGHA